MMNEQQGETAMIKLGALQDQDFMRDPTPTLAALREEGSFARSSIPLIGKVWLTTTQAAAVRILKDDKTFTVRRANGKVIGMQWWMPSFIRRLSVNMLSSDEPDHKRLRSMVDEAFRRREIVQLEERAELLAEGYAEQLVRLGDGADLIQNLARPLPLSVICELLGLPGEDQEKFMQWAAALTGVNSIFSVLVAMWRLGPLTRYIDDRIGKVREGDRAGLLGSLVELGEDGAELSDDELSAMVFLLLMAGHETTTHLISGSVLALLQHREQLEMLRDDWSLLDGAVEETLRFVSPVQSTKPRYVRSDMEIEGTVLKAGDIVMPLLVAANHDPAVFESPEVFDITRKPNRHVEFGTGIHFCLGHQLARVEAKAAIGALFTRFADIRLAVPVDELSWHERFGIRSLKVLPLAGLYDAR
jgi:cytochrome P450 PksS